MKNVLYKLTFTFGLLTISTFSFGQTGVASGLGIAGIIGIAVLLILGVIVLVSDNLIAIEAKQSNVNTRDVNLSIFPRGNEIFRPKLPAHVDPSRTSVLRQGFDIKLAGSAEERIADNVHVSTYAVQPKNYLGVQPIPKMLVEVGDNVKAGDPLFFDKKNPDVKFVAPVSGEVIAINRAEKRSISEVVILADKEIAFRELPGFDLGNGSREDLVQYLMANGAWPLIRQRPYNVIADQNETPRDIFVSTFSTSPLAPNQEFVIQGREAAFDKGLEVLSKLTDGSVYLGANANSTNDPAAAFTESAHADVRFFHGKHPAGNVGVQIHHIAPINANDKVWTLGVQEVITLGNLFLENRYNAERVVAVTGAQAQEPAYVKTYAGASMKDLFSGGLKEGASRLISGDVLSGATKTEDSFLNFYDTQVTAIEEGDYYEMFGWLLPIAPRPSMSRTFPNFLFPDLEFKGDTNSHGEQRAFVVTGQYEQVLPMDIYPQHLMKAIIVNDYERMEGLGIYELVEEDVALCEFVCTSKQPLQSILREGLEMMREQG